MASLIHFNLTVFLPKHEYLSPSCQNQNFFHGCRVSATYCRLLQAAHLRESVISLVKIHPLLTLRSSCLVFPYWKSFYILSSEPHLVCSSVPLVLNILSAVGQDPNIFTVPPSASGVLFQLTPF